MKPEKIHGLVEALHHWLSFQILYGREELLSESYLNQPTGEYLLHASGSSCCVSPGSSSATEQPAETEQIETHAIG